MKFITKILCNASDYFFSKESNSFVGCEITKYSEVIQEKNVEVKDQSTEMSETVNLNKSNITAIKLLGFFQWLAPNTTNLGNTS